MIRVVMCCVAVVGAFFVASFPAQAATAAKGTVACSGSFDGKGKYRTDEKGAYRYYYARKASCPAARKLITTLSRDDDSGYSGRAGTVLTTVRVPGGSVWKCRAFVRISERRKLAVAEISCRPLTGRADRRITLRSTNLAAEEDGGS